ncbi:uncharacterized protein [Aegilops tauschii subsp. strangulata]|uniref:uncharacterized protein n=1 Tax=Aegilops tauschii subsp. strangulata TaxID=200361 RepID=UPI001ABCE306|nr:uncharacterized protein LOC109754173 [Aegilops tauschii subsp. strangulata]
MAASGGSCGGCAWPDLQPEMLGVVLSRVPSHADRVRLAAVCRPWRSTARLLRPLPRARRRQALAGELLPPLLPWLALCDGTFLSLPDGAVHRLPVADDASSRVSTGSALFLVHGDGRCCLMNPSPVTTSPVPEAADWFRENPTVRKVLMSDHLVAALVKSNERKINSSTTTKIIISTRGQPDADFYSSDFWTPLILILQHCFKIRALDTMRCSTTEWAAPEDSCVSDIALFKGKLYVLLDTQDGEYGQQHELRVLDDGREQTAIPGTRIHGHESFNAYATDMYVQRNYLVVSGDRLLMVERRIYQPPMLPVDSGIEKRTRLFKVFEATDLSIGRGLWTEVDTLMGRALFVSGGCSQSLPAGGQSSGVGAREDCIYFVNEDHADTDISDFEEEICENPFLDSGVYNMGDHTMTPLPSEAVAAPAAGDGPWSPTWLFPET